jgi:hypothetical protein
VDHDLSSNNPSLTQAGLPDLPTITDSVTYVVCSPRICGLRSDSLPSIKVHTKSNNTSRMIDGGSNICVTGDLNSLLNIVNTKPITISVDIEGSPTSYNDCITKRGLLPLLLSDGTTYYQTCFYCTNMVETIISPAAVLALSNVFYCWTQDGFKDPSKPGSIRFSSHDGLVSMHFPLTCNDGLYYCNTNVYTVNHDPVRIQCRRTTTTPPYQRPPSKFPPTTKARQVESEVWALRFGSPGEGQMGVLPRHVDGTPPVFEYHPFWFIDFKEQAYIRQQPAQRTAKRLDGCSSKFFMDFGFMRASKDDYKRPNKSGNRIVFSYDGYCAYLLIVHGASQRVWAFLTKSNEPPIALLCAFMTKFSHPNGIIRTDQGGELVQSKKFQTTMLKEFAYIVEPSGVGSPSQNGGAEIYNNTLAVKVRTLLYGSGLPAKFWLAALLHAVYLQNRLVHSATGITPFEGWYGQKPNVAHLKMFGSRICVKRTGSQRSKLDLHNFTEIFLGYTAMDQNIIYLDTTTGIVKSCHHAVFNEAWYLQPSRPPAAQLLYDLGLEAEMEFVSHKSVTLTPAGTISPITIPWPPVAPGPQKLTIWSVPSSSIFAPLPLRMTDEPHPLAARAVHTQVSGPTLLNQAIMLATVTKYLIGPHDMEVVYLSSDPYGQTFEEQLDLCKCNMSIHWTAGLRFIVKDGPLILASMDKSTPGARVDKWRTCIWGAWLQSIDGSTVTSIKDAAAVFARLSTTNATTCTLVFSHPDTSPDISHNGLPIISHDNFSQFTHDQLNNGINLFAQGPPLKRVRQ